MKVITQNVNAGCHSYSSLVWFGVRKSQSHEKQRVEDLELISLLLLCKVLHFVDRASCNVSW